ncbi:SGNH/GDSL hydrolase family protein [Rhodococcus kronopolitis]|uniref:SGNH/GDSL hydrolase family protein n=1 Tax=Rhodococcus kronopolitis TaxID=1460226 RepID=A0ABV9FYP7_9NOCA
MNLTTRLRLGVAAVGALAAVAAFASPTVAAEAPPGPGAPPGPVALTEAQPGAPAQAALAPGAEYVSLGDSYGAGTGVFPLAEGPPPWCLQSSQNYSHLVAAQLGYRLTDVSCGSATAIGLGLPLYPGMRPQLDALTPTTELVTLMVGGNDHNTFGGAVAACIAARASNPGAYDPCRAQYGAGMFAPIVTGTHPDLVGALRAIHARSPRARVVVVGYPWLFPGSGSCAAQIPVADGDMGYLRELQTVLNDAMRRAAQETDSAFVDMSQVSDGRDGCQPAGHRWVEPILNTGQPIHPNAAGERAIADQVVAVLGR